MNNLPEVSKEYEEAARLHSAIITDAKGIEAHLISLCRNLYKMNEKGLFRTLGFSDIGEYAKAAIGMEKRQAYNYIEAYREYGEEGLTAHSNLGITKLVTLIQLDDGERKEIIESGAAEELSTRELQALVDTLKVKCEQLTFEIEEADGAKDEISGELEAARSKISEYEAKIRELENRPVEVAVSEPTPEQIEAIRSEIQAENSEEIRHRDSRIKKLTEDMNRQTQEIKKAKTRNEELSEKIKIAEQEFSKEQEKTRAFAKELSEAKSKLQSLAQSQQTKPNEGKALLKYHFQNILNAFNESLAVITALDGDEKDKFSNALKSVVSQMSAEVEKL